MRLAQLMNVIIFTDLDGTLLDAETYSYEAALPALNLAREKGVPLVFISSKTRAELEIWRRRLQNEHPFVVENGGGIYIPEGYFPFPVPGTLREGYRLISLGKPYGVIRKHFAEMRERLGIAVRGFGDMTVEEVAALTGLTRDDAELARQRDFSEPFVFPGPVDERFLQAVEGAKLRWTQGQFFHLMGDHHKGRAVDKLRSLYERKLAPLTTVGIGDALNDLPFLLAVDRPVLVKKKAGKHEMRIDVPGLIRTEGTGPTGWNQAVMELLRG
jgi:mannosyl-3-phosphoglycerate phosphatase